MTLDLCEGLLTSGLILKDATPLNVLFRGPRPVFVDVLSVEERDPASPLWLAYGQFVRTFLLPLVAHQYLGWPLSASMQKRDGYEPANLAPHLSRWQRWREPFRSLVTMPLMLEKDGARARRTLGCGRTRRWRFRCCCAIWAGCGDICGVLEGAAVRRHPARWSGYQTSADHYSVEDQKLKRQFVREALTAAQPKHVLDLGATAGFIRALRRSAARTW